MATTRDLYYSPICDRDPRAYLAYIFACSQYGAGNDKFAKFNGQSSKSRHNDSRDNFGIGPIGSIAGVGKDESANVVVGMVANGDIDGVVDFVNNGAKAELSSWYTAAGFSADNVDYRGNSVDSFRGVYARRIGGNVDDSDISVESLAITGSKEQVGVGQSVEQCSADSDVVEVCSGDVVESVSQKTLLNRERRVKRKERKLRRQAVQRESSVPEWRRNAGSETGSYRGAFSTCSEEVRRELADTRAKRLIAENNACVRKAQAESDRWSESMKLQRKQDNLSMLKVGKQIEALRSSGVETIQEDLEQRRLSQQLKIVQTRQKLELASAQDIESLKRRQASKVLRDTETNKVAVERAYGALAGSDNLPSLVGGKVYTVKSGSISPNSSASEAEVRAIQKKNLDLEKRVEELTAELGKLRTGTGERQDYDGYDYSEGVTIDEDGHPIGDFGDYSGYIGRDNRFHFGESMMPYFD